MRSKIKRIVHCFSIVFIAIFLSFEAFCDDECTHQDSDYNFCCDLCNYNYKLIGYGICDEEVVGDLYDDGTLYLYGEICSYSSVPDYVSYVYDNSFSSAGLNYYQNTVKRIYIENGVKNINSFAFVNFTALEEIVIPKSVKYIAPDAFAGSGLTDVVIDRYNSYFTFEDGVLYNKDKTALISYLSSNTSPYFAVPDTVTEIRDKAFAFNRALKNLFIPEGVSSIGESCFDTREGFSEKLENIFYGGTEECFASIYDFSSFDLNIYTSHTHGDFDADGNCIVCYPYDDTHSHSYSSSVVEPTCTENGYTLFQCEGCDYSYIGEKREALGHSMSEYITVTQATCISEGLKEASCQRCSLIRTETIPVSDEHDYEIINTSFTYCDEEGCVTYECTLCEYILTEIIEPGEHSLSFTVYEPSCTEEGYTVYCCDYCPYSYRGNETQPTGHLMGEAEIISPSTCSQDGESSSACQRCNYSESYILPSTGEHSFTASVFAADCTCEGYTLYSCNNCDFTYTDSLEPATGHNFTCDENRTNIIYNDDNTHTFTCLNGCGVTGTTLSGVGGKEDCTFVHISDKEPTCTEKGFSFYMCSVCYFAKTTELPVKAHNFTTSIVQPSCLEEGFTLHTCNGCGMTYKDNITSPTDHISDGGTITLQPSYSSTGTKVYSCRICDAVIESEELPKLIKVTASQTVDSCTDPYFEDEITSVKITSVKTKSLTLKWTIIREADSYTVSYSTDGKEWKKLKSEKNTLKIKKLESGKKYFIKIEALKNGSTVAQSDVISSATKPEKPSVTSLKIKKKKVFAEWKKVNNADGYEVLISSSSKFLPKKSKAYNTKKCRISFRKIKNSKKLYFKVRAYKTVNKKKVYSAYSNIKSIKLA